MMFTLGDINEVIAHCRRGVEEKRMMCRTDYTSQAR